MGHLPIVYPWSDWSTIIAFDPIVVFRTLYREYCREGFHRGVTATSGGLAPLKHLANWVDLVERRFQDFFQKLQDDPNASAASIHLNNVRRFLGLWRRISSHDTCLLCLVRTPDGPILDCQPSRHHLCTTCVQIFGESSAEDPWTFQLRRCPLCRQHLDDCLIGVVPAKASLRVLSIDGGGQRVVAPLEMLRLVDEYAQVPFLTRRAFDFAVGNSSGK